MSRPPVFLPSIDSCWRQYSPASCFEAVFVGGASPTGIWRAPPGRVLRLDSGSRAMNFAPARWLLLDVGESGREAAADAGAVLFNVEEKWRIFEFLGANAKRTLAAALDVSSVLRARDCAAVMAFDAPAIVCQTGEGDQILVCVQASFADNFTANIQAAQEQMA